MKEKANGTTQDFVASPSPSGRLCRPVTIVLDDQSFPMMADREIAAALPMRRGGPTLSAASGLCAMGRRRGVAVPSSAGCLCRPPWLGAGR